MTVVHRLFCENCGFETHDMVRFCPRCGSAPMKDRRLASCPECGRGFREIDNFCSGCGYDLRDFKQTKPMYCKKCGFMLGAGAAFCCECGYPLEGASNANAANDDPAITLYGLPPIRGSAPVYGTPRRFGKTWRFRK